MMVVLIGLKHPPPSLNQCIRFVSELNLYVCLFVCAVMHAGMYCKGQWMDAVIVGRMGCWVC